MYTFYSQFSTRTDRKSMAKRAGCSKNPLFFVLKISFIQWGINETIKRLSWKFEENRTSGRFYFSNKKKNIRNGIHCTYQVVFAGFVFNQFLSDFKNKHTAAKVLQLAKHLHLHFIYLNRIVEKYTVLIRLRSCRGGGGVQERKKYHKGMITLGTCSTRKGDRVR